MTLREQIKSNFSNAVNKDGEIFKAMFTNEKNTGALEVALQDTIDYMDEWTDTPSIYDQDGDLFDKTAAFFLHIDTLTDEDLSIYKQRIKALFARESAVLGTPYDIETTFRAYLGSSSVYVCENCKTIESDENDRLLKDGNFEIDDESSPWTYFEAYRHAEARFSKDYGAEINSTVSYIKQSIDVSEWDNAVYFIHYFIQGDTALVIYDTENKKYWNVLTNQWQETAIRNVKSGGKVWKAKSVWFKKTEGMTTIDFYFYGSLDSEDLMEESVMETYEHENIEYDEEDFNDLTTPPKQTAEGYETEDIDYETYWESGVIPEEKDPTKFDYTDIDYVDDWGMFGWIDYIRIFKHERIPSFLVIIQDIERDSNVSLAVESGVSDPESGYGTEAVKHHYFDKNYMTSMQSQYVKNLYQDLLKYVTAQGVRSGIEYVYKTL